MHDIDIVRGGHIQSEGSAKDAALFTVFDGDYAKCDVGWIMQFSHTLMNAHGGQCMTQSVVNRLETVAVWRTVAILYRPFAVSIDACDAVGPIQPAGRPRPHAIRPSDVRRQTANISDQFGVLRTAWSSRDWRDDRGPIYQLTAATRERELLGIRRLEYV